MKFLQLHGCATALLTRKLLNRWSNAGRICFKGFSCSSEEHLMIEKVQPSEKTLAAVPDTTEKPEGVHVECGYHFGAAGLLHLVTVTSPVRLLLCSRHLNLRDINRLGTTGSLRGFTMQPHNQDGQLEHDLIEKESTKGATFFQDLAEGLPLVVKATASAGRGLYAAANIAEGEVIQDVAPIVAHPTLRNIGHCCYLCLKYTSEASRHFLDKALKTATKDLQPSFCSEECALYAEEQFFSVERTADWSKLFDHCRAHDLRFPLLVARLACMVASAAAEPDILRPLCFVKTDPPPQQWVEEHSMVYEALRASGQSKETLDFLTLDWYVSVIARLHLNSFQVDIVRPLNPSDLLAAASEAAAGHGSAGSAVYLLPSMYNHSCEPTVDIHWPRDAIARFEARRDIQKGEELTITYIDASLPVETRQKHLEWAYGFQCRCQRCRDEMEPT